MLDFVGMIVAATVMVVIAAAVVPALPMSQAKRAMLAALVGSWIGFSAAAASAGWIAISHPFPVIGLFVAFPLIAVAIAAAVSPSARTALLDLPMALLVGLNLSRVLGALFLWLAADGRLSGPFPYSAAWGDILTGVLAIPALWLALHRSAGGDRLLAAWNIFGALDLIAAVALGVLSGQGSPVQVLHVGVGAQAMQYLPWSLVPTVLVPYYLIAHGVIGLKLRLGANWGNQRNVAVSGYAA